MWVTSTGESHFTRLMLVIFYASSMLGSGIKRAKLREISLSRSTNLVQMLNHGRKEFKIIPNGLLFKPKFAILIVPSDFD